MELDADCLLEARVENLERLALSLGVRLPPRQGRERQYARKLVRVLVRAIAEDRRAHPGRMRAARAALN